MTYRLLTAVLWGALLGWWTPRGPLTATQALISIVGSAAVGLHLARLPRSRRLLPLLAYAVALEVLRSLSRAPTADIPHPTAFGLVALLAGRGVQYLVTLVPMLLARRGIVLLPVLLVLVTLAAVPARTPGIPGGVAELARVNDLRVMIRGRDLSRPVLLFVPGAPGGSELGAMRRHLAALESRFVVATLDRRGGGGSYAALGDTVTVGRSVDDIVAVTDYLRRRFGRERIVLLAHSGGSVLGVLVVQRHPEKYSAYVGTGQAVDVRESDLIFYQDVLAWAERTGRADLAGELREQGPPPYPDFWSYEPLMLNEGAAYGQRSAAFDVGVSEYSPLQRVHTLNAIMDTWAALYPRMQDVDLRESVTRLDVPAYFIQGEGEMRGLSEVFARWYPGLTAPAKRLIVIPGGHRAMFESPDRFVAALDSLSLG
ncbi:alpha/beta hydrolase [Actinoplanes sp. NPDC051851]|uniref:alpha/beta fold hydrolase n=1 Tax=Actinoplanes sp. NPDC051851 TaxID=3154753 RepID=UPI00342F5B52